MAVNEFRSSRYKEDDGVLYLTSIGLSPERLWVTVSILVLVLIYVCYFLCGLVCMRKIEHRPPMSGPLDDAIEENASNGHEVREKFSIAYI